MQHSSINTNIDNKTSNAYTAITRNPELDKELKKCNRSRMVRSAELGYVFGTIKYYEEDEANQAFMLAYINGHEKVARIIYDLGIQLDHLRHTTQK